MVDTEKNDDDKTSEALMNRLETDDESLLELTIDDISLFSLRVDCSDGNMSRYSISWPLLLLSSLLRLVIVLVFCSIICSDRNGYLMENRGITIG